MATPAVLVSIRLFTLLLTVDVYGTSYSLSLTSVPKMLYLDENSLSSLKLKSTSLSES